MNLQSITSSLRYLQGEQGSLLPVPVAYVQNTNGTVSPVYVPRPQRGGAGGLGGAHRYSTGDISLMGLHTVEEGGEGAQARHSNSLGRRSEKVTVITLTDSNLAWTLYRLDMKCEI